MAWISGRQPIGGKSPDACPSCDRKHGPGKCRKKRSVGSPLFNKCEMCNNEAKKGSRKCGPCAEKKKLNESKAKKGKRSKKKKTDEKKRFGWSQASTIHVKGVAKNRWLGGYKGPKFRNEKYLMEDQQDERNV